MTTAAADLSVEWYYVTSAGEQAGPVNVDELRYLHSAQQTNDDCLCWTEQLPGWTAIREVAQLQQHFALKPSPPSLPTPSIQLALPPLNTSAEVAPAPASPSGSSSGRSTMSRKTGQLVAQHAKYKTLTKKDRSGGSSSGASSSTSSLNGKGVSDMVGAAQKKYGTLKVGKSAASNGLSPASPSNTAQVAPLNGDAAAAPRNPSTCASPTAATSAVFDAFNAAVAAMPSAVDPSAYPASQSPDVISSNLVAAITALDAEALTAQLAAGDAVALDEAAYIASPLGRMYLAKLDEVRARMREAVRVMDEAALCQAVYAAEAIGYNKLDVASCRKLCDAVIQLNVEARQQLVVLDERKMRNIIARAEQLSITSPAASATGGDGCSNSNATIEQLRLLLDSTSDEKFRQLQLKAANALGDKHRATRITIALKQLVHKRTAHMFTLDSYAKWRGADEWAGEKLGLGGKKELADGMKRWTRDTIHTSLTRLPSKECNKLACKAFKRLLVYCGDRTSDGGDKAVGGYDVLRELLDIGLQHKEVRDELFIQLMKQLTANPNTDSERRVWTAMYTALETFPPGSDLENILEIFLSKHVLYGSAAIQMLHHTLYDGPRRCVPSEAEVAVMAAGKSIRHCAYEDEREYHTWRAVLPQQAEVQPLAGTTAAGMKEFVESGGVPDWSEIEIRMPPAEHWQQPEFKLEVKPKKAPPSPSPDMRTTAPSTTVTPAAPPAAVTIAAPAAQPLARVSSSQLSTAINSPASSRPITQPSTPRNARLVVDTAAPPPLLSTVAPLSPLPLSPLSPSMMPTSPTSAVSDAAPVAPPMSVSSNTADSSASSHSTDSTASSPLVADIPEPPALLSASSAAAVPPPPPRAACVWAKTVDPSSGQFYYYHTETMEVTWDQPADYFE